MQKRRPLLENKKQMRPVHHHKIQEVCEAKVVRVSQKEQNMKRRRKSKKTNPKVHTRDTLPELQVHASSHNNKGNHTLHPAHHPMFTTTPAQVVQSLLCVPAMHVISVAGEERREKMRPAQPLRALPLLRVPSIVLEKQLRHPGRKKGQMAGWECLLFPVGRHLQGVGAPRGRG